MAGSSYSEYKKYIRNLIAVYGRSGIIVGAVPLVFLPAQKVSLENGGVIRTNKPDLRFKDGAFLRMQEEVSIVNNQIERLRYTYHYERPGGYFFRYEREPTTDPIRKPEYHCHVVLNLPHFIAPPVSLKTILELIATNFYAVDVYHKQIVGQEIHLTV